MFKKQTYMKKIMTINFFYVVLFLSCNHNQQTNIYIKDLNIGLGDNYDKVKKSIKFWKKDYENITNYDVYYASFDSKHLGDDSFERMYFYFKNMELKYVSIIITYNNDGNKAKYLNYLNDKIHGIDIYDKNNGNSYEIIQNSSKNSYHKIKISIPATPY